MFLQVHLVLGLLLGPLATQAFDQAKGPALAAAAAPAAAALFFWRVRRRKHADPSAWQEATCRVCVTATLLADRVPALADLTGPDPALPPTRPGDREPGSVAPAARRPGPR